MRRKRRWPHLIKFKPFRKKPYDDCHTLHLYEEEIVMREIERAATDGLQSVSAHQLDARHPDGFRMSYLNKTLKRLHDKHMVARHPAPRAFGRAMWAYSIMPLPQPGGVAHGRPRRRRAQG